MGVKVPRAMRAYFDPSSIPNQITNKGSNAILGIGKMAATNGTRPARARLNSPIITPTAIPVLTPSADPTARRVTEGIRCSHSIPVTHRSWNVPSTSEGRGSVRFEITPVRVPHSTSRISATITAAPR